MSVLTYHTEVSPKDKPLVWLSGEVKTRRCRQKSGWRRVSCFDDCSAEKR